jgi:hypothetical protein
VEHDGSPADQGSDFLVVADVGALKIDAAAQFFEIRS